MLPNLIYLSETKHKNQLLNNVSLPRYAPLIIADSDINAGGVGAYVSENSSATVLDKYLLQSNYEDLCLQIVDKSSQEPRHYCRHPKVMLIVLFRL